MSPENEKKAERILKVAKDGIPAIVEELNVLEDRIDAIPVPLQGIQGERGEQGIQGKEGKDGVDGKDGSNGKDGKDGRNGINGKDGSPDTPEQVRNKLESLKDEERLDAKYIKNLPKSETKLIGGGQGIHEVRAGTNITVDNSQLGYPIISATGSGSTAWGDITGTLSNQTDLQTALDAKIDTSLAIALAVSL